MRSKLYESTRRMHCYNNLILYFQEAEVPCLLLLLPECPAIANLRAMWQDQVYAEDGRLPDPASGNLHQWHGHGWSDLRLLRGLDLPRPEVPSGARLCLSIAGEWLSGLFIIVTNPLSPFIPGCRLCGMRAWRMGPWWSHVQVLLLRCVPLRR